MMTAQKTLRSYLAMIFGRTLFRNQEEVVLGQGVSAESNATTKKPKIPKDIRPSSAFSTQSATAERGP